jgi:hypothetical protein
MDSIKRDVRDAAFVVDEEVSLCDKNVSGTIMTDGLLIKIWWSVLIYVWLSEIWEIC